MRSMRGSKPNKDDLIRSIGEFKTIWKVADAFGVTYQSIRNWMKEYDVKTPKGFFSRGLPVGRRPGFKHSAEIIEEMRKRMTGENNPFWRKKHSDKTRQKMSENHADVSGDKNPFKRSLLCASKREEHKQRCKDSWSKRDGEWRRRFSEKLSARPAEKSGGNGLGRHERGLHISEKGGTFWYRSSWERVVAEVLDESGLVSSYEYEQERIPYEDQNGVIRHFVPDFVVTATSGHKALLEIKPRPLVEASRWKIISQYEYALLNGLQYRLLTKNDIFGSGSLTVILEETYNGELYAVSFERCGID